MKVVFSDHARLKIRQRKLPRRSVLETIEGPDSVVQSHGGREIFLKKFRINHMHVVIKREAGTIIVVTAHWVARPKKAK